MAQDPVPLHAPLQPAKAEPAHGLAVSVTDVPPTSIWVQLRAQLMPAAALVTVPAPGPFFLIDSFTEAAAVADPLTPRETVSPPAVNLALPANAPAAVGRNRTVTARLAPAPSEKEAADVTLKGAPALTATEVLAPLVFCTVKVRSAVPPIVTLPKLLLPDGVTARVGWATPVAAPEHALSLPLVSTAVRRT
jgi:hypothetical protein